MYNLHLGFVKAKSADPDQMAPPGAILSGSTLFTISIRTGLSITSVNVCYVGE